MARRKAPIIPDDLLDQLLAGPDPQAALGKDGLVDELKRALAERALNAEMDHHLDGEAAEGRTHSRNGYGQRRCSPTVASWASRCRAIVSRPSIRS
jgi:putative transposase